jgi:hypothetical protein
MTNANQFPGANYRGQMDSIAEVIMWGPKIVQCIQAFNEEDLILPVLRSIYNSVDHIRVIEGAVENQVDATEDGHSTDKTVEIIKQFIAEEDKDKKVNFVQRDKPFKNLEEMKQTFLDYAVRGEWLLINDCDEFYKPEDIDRLRIAIDRNPTASEFVPLFLHFYRDFQHIAKPAAEWQPQHQRFFRFVPGMRYNSHPVVTDVDGQCTYFSPNYQQRRIVVKDWYVWHYGYARKDMNSVMEKKKKYYEKELSKHGGANKPFDEKADIFLYRKERSQDFCMYPLGLHPEVIKTHPMYEHKDLPWARVGKFDCVAWDSVEPYCLDEVPNIFLWMTGLNPKMGLFSNQITLADLK